MLIGIDASRAAVMQRTGTENYSLYLIRALVELGRSHRFRLYFNQPPPAGLFPQNERIEWRLIPFPRLWTHIRLAVETLLHPPDILFVPSHVLPWLHPRRCVATVHDLGYLGYPDAHRPGDRRYLEWATRFNARVARRVIVDSEATRKDLIFYYDIDPDKLVVAYPAGAEGFCPVTDAQALENVRQRYHTGREYFLYVGTLQPRKNLTTLIRAFAALLDDGTLCEETNLVLAGKRGWLTDEMDELVEELGLRERIVFPGYVEVGDLNALLSGALAFVLPSWYEGFGLPILEAMACETPVICSNASSLPEVAGDAALLFAPHDVGELAQAMRRLYSDAGLRDELIRRGRERWQWFSWQRCAQTVLETLEAVGHDTPYEQADINSHPGHPR